MVGEQIQNYVNLVAGLRRATKAKAADAAQGLLSATGLDDVAADAGERVGALAEEILAASRANRELLVKMINTEVDKAAGRIGFARAEDLEALRGEVADLRAAVSQQAARAATAEAAAPAKKAAAKKAAAKKAPAKKAPATRAPARKSSSPEATE